MPATVLMIPRLLTRRIRLFLVSAMKKFPWVSTATASGSDSLAPSPDRRPRRTHPSPHPWPAAGDRKDRSGTCRQLDRRSGAGWTDGRRRVAMPGCVARAAGSAINNPATVAARITTGATISGRRIQRGRGARSALIVVRRPSESGPDPPRRPGRSAGWPSVQPSFSKFRARRSVVFSAVSGSLTDRRPASSPVNESSSDVAVGR